MNLSMWDRETVPNCIRLLVREIQRNRSFNVVFGERSKRK